MPTFVQGRLLYCHPPPGVDAVEFNSLVVGPSAGSQCSEGVESTENAELVMFCFEPRTGNNL